MSKPHLVPVFVSPRLVSSSMNAWVHSPSDAAKSIDTDVDRHGSEEIEVIGRTDCKQ